MLEMERRDPLEVFENKFLDNLLYLEYILIFMTNYCFKCKIKISDDVYNYSIKKYNIPLCRKHQDSYTEVKMKSEKRGISKKESYYTESKIKGRIAETLIEELFLSLGYSVFRYGMENTVPGIMSLLKGVRSDVANDIRRMPDFVAQDRNGEVYFIEVKFRAKEEFAFKDLPEDYPYENAFFVLVSKKHIKCINYKELKEGGKITPESRNYLGSRKEFELDKEVIIQFCDFAVKFFKEV